LIFPLNESPRQSLGSSLSLRSTLANLPQL
jgi:hypothetical protein